MSEQANNARQVLLQKIYVKDASLEVPLAPDVFTRQWQPQVDVQVNTEMKPLAADNVQVMLSVTVTAKLGTDVAFLAEVHQAGVFLVRGFDDATERQALLDQHLAIDTADIVLLAVGGIGRHEVGNVAMDEELAAVGPEDRGDMHARVAARDHHGARPLPVIGQSSVPDVVFRERRGAPAMIALDEIVGQWTCNGHEGLGSDLGQLDSPPIPKLRAFSGGSLKDFLGASLQSAPDVWGHGVRQ